jgi:hypothetical protein
LRQVGLGERLAPVQPFVSNIEKGRRRVDVLELREICAACGTPLAAFIVRLEERLGGGA